MKTVKNGIREGRNYDGGGRGREGEEVIDGTERRRLDG